MITQTVSKTLTTSETLRLWEVESGRCLRVLEGHANPVLSLALSADGDRALSGSADGTMRLWELESGRCLRVLEGHTEHVFSLALSADGACALSGSSDNTVRVWEVESGRCLRVLEGHNSWVTGIAWSPDGLQAISFSANGVVRVWNLTKILSSHEATLPAFSVSGRVQVIPAQVQYTNAKVLLVGDSGVGKTGLSNYLARGIKVEDYNPLPSTDGAWATHWPLPHDKKDEIVEREIWLWDFAGQVDYRLVHQLYMDDTSAAVLVFNPQNENPFDGLSHWDHDLRKAARKPFAKLLVAGRVDRGGLVVSDTSMKKFMVERGFLDPLHLTSAKTEEGCDELRKAIVDAIDWTNIPETTSPALYHRLKQEILSLRDNGIVLIRLSELKQRLEMTLREENFELAELETVVSLLSGPGMIQRLDFGGFILLRPDVLSRYAAAVVRRVRKHPQELGCIREDELLAGNLDYQDFERLPREDEVVVLQTLLETFISRAWCLRQPCDGSAMLTFPSYFRREREEKPSHPSVLVTYRFDGPIHEIYATLVVRLHHTVAFESADLWQSAADFQTQTGEKLGIVVQPLVEGTSQLEVYFDPEVDENSRVLFLRYIHDHLTRIAQNVVRLRQYSCRNRKCKDFERPYRNQEAIDEALAADGAGKVFCGKCGKPIPLRDTIEKKFNSPGVKEQVRELEAEAKSMIDKESCELILLGHALSIAAEAGQVFKKYDKRRNGLDGEIELVGDHGRATGKALYLHFNATGSKFSKFIDDEAESFEIENFKYHEKGPVLIVMRRLNGDIFWIAANAIPEPDTDSRRGRRLDGELAGRFDVMSVRRWRDRILFGK